MQCFCSVLIKPFTLLHYYYCYYFLLLQFSNCFLLQRFPRILKFVLSFLSLLAPQAATVTTYACTFRIFEQCGFLL
jgi:hypothetical protein